MTEAQWILHELREAPTRHGLLVEELVELRPRHLPGPEEHLAHGAGLPGGREQRDAFRGHVEALLVGALVDGEDAALAAVEEVDEEIAEAQDRNIAA